MEERLQRALDDCPEDGTFHLPTGEFEGPFVLRRRIMLVGERTTLWSRKGPVLTVEAAGTRLSGLNLEVTKPEGGGWDTVCLASRSQEIGLEEVCVNGAVSGLGEEDAGFLLPQVLDLGAFPAGRRCRFWVTLTVPAAAELESRIEGLSAAPFRLVPGVNRVELSLAPVEDGVLIYGELAVKSRLIRTILVGGRCTASAAGYQDGKTLGDAAGRSETVEPAVIRGEGWRGGNIAPPVLSAAPAAAPVPRREPAPVPPPPAPAPGAGTGRVNLTRNRVPKSQRVSHMHSVSPRGDAAQSGGGSSRGTAAAQSGPQPFRDAAGNINLTRCRTPKGQRVSRLQDSGVRAGAAQGARPLPAAERTPLVPGQKVPLGPAFESGVQLALGWEGVDAPTEIELFLLLLGADQRARSKEDLICLANRRSSDGAAELLADGCSAALCLGRLPADVQRVAVACAVSGGARCSAVRSLCLGAGPASGGAGFRFEPSGLRDESAVVLAEIYRRGGEWRLGAVGAGFAGGLSALCRSYGIEMT